MRLTRYTDYSIRVLIYLSLHEDDRLSSIQEIADVYGISKNHLIKVVHELGKLGLVETMRGRGGGIRLHMDPKKINLGWLVRQTEEDFNLVECFSNENNTCIISECCKLKGVLRQALQAYLAVLDGYTLADIITNKDEIRSLLTEEG